MMRDKDSFIMPELPEVETVKAAMVPVMEGGVIRRADIRRPDLRWPLPDRLAERLTNQAVQFVIRRAKVILIGLTDEVMMLHLGMSGSVRISPHQPNAKLHDHIELYVEHEAGHHYVTYNDPRRFGYVDLVARDALLSHKSLATLGPEPVPQTQETLDFGPILTESYLNEALAGSQAPIKSFLLDQRQIAGLGNIYVCEALYRSGISPRRKAATVKGARARRLLPAIRDVLSEAIAQGGTSLRDHRQPDGKLGYFVQSLDVYGRQGAPCHQCQSDIKAITQSGRSSFYCPRCQR